LGLFLFLPCSILLSDTPYKPIISTIEVRGNTKTQDYVLIREILHPINNPLDSIIVIEDRNRLDNLGLFSESTWQVVPLEDGTAKLVFVVTEYIELLHWHCLHTMKIQDGHWLVDGSLITLEVEINFWLWGAVLVVRTPMA